MPPLYAIPKKKKTLQGRTGSLPAEVDNVTVIERRLIHVPPFLIFFFNTPERRKTDAVRGAGASLPLTRPICVLGKNVLTGTLKRGERGEGRGGGTTSLNKGLCSRSNGSARVRACVRRERYDLSLLWLHTCVLCLSAILK